MAGETVITVIGNLTGDPELRFTPSGAAVASFTVASTPRTLDKATNEWKDGEALFLRCSIWRQAAENVAESLQKGMRVIVSGRLAAAVVRHEGGREAHRDRAAGRRDRPVAEVRHREGQPDHARRRRSGGFGGAPSGGGGSSPLLTTRGPPRPRASGGGGGGWSSDEPPF